MNGAPDDTLQYMQLERDPSLYQFARQGEVYEVNLLIFIHIELKRLPFMSTFLDLIEFSSDPVSEMMQILLFYSLISL